MNTKIHFTSTPTKLRLCNYIVSFFLVCCLFAVNKPKTYVSCCQSSVNMSPPKFTLGGLFIERLLSVQYMLIVGSQGFNKVRENCQSLYCTKVLKHGSVCYPLRSNIWLLMCIACIIYCKFVILELNKVVP